MSTGVASHDRPDTPCGPHSGSPLPGSPRPAGSVISLDRQGWMAALRAAGAWLDAHLEVVNALNVFPVPDGDTGTNMSLTMRAALAEGTTCVDESVSELAKLVSHGALMGARGNSGVILSQILRGVARGLGEKKVVTAPDLALALREGSVTAYKGVMKPVEGTILTVVREAAEAAEQAAARGGDLLDVLAHTVESAQTALARTPELLRVLAEAGVVDAGGQGLVFILEGMLKSMRGEPLDAVPVAAAQAHHYYQSDETYNYDTQFIIHGTALDVDAIREGIAVMGDSVLVVGDERAAKVHVHCDHPGEAIEYGLTCGTVDAIIIENMQLQYEAFKAAQATPSAPPPVRAMLKPERLGEISVVAVSAGAGIKSVLESLGVDGVVHGGQTMNPSTQDLLVAAEDAPCQKVIILPNNGNIVLTARQAKELSAKQVAVVPTKTIPQGIAALLAFNYQSSLEENVAAMTEASQQ
ncbi:MAG: DAK2 domain-containing protein, partial [Chloroflexota bacterium]